MSKILSWAGFVGLAFLAAVPGMWAKPGAWYAGLTKPSFNPPGWVFGPVWTTLYVLIGTSAWLVYSRHSHEKARVAMICWAIQMILNAAWSPLFFGTHRIDLAFITIFAMLLAIIVTIVQFKELEPTAGMLLVPYALWVGFATLLNFSLWRLNP